ncbi:unnamed protein product, partial [Didymodactylos carnosus]
KGVTSGFWTNVRCDASKTRRHLESTQQALSYHKNDNKMQSKIKDILQVHNDDFTKCPDHLLSLLVEPVLKCITERFALQDSVQREDIEIVYQISLIENKSYRTTARPHTTIVAFYSR